MRRQRASGRRRSAPSPRAGCVDQDPVEDAGSVRRQGAVRRDHADGAGHQRALVTGGEGALDEPGTGGQPLVRHQAGPPLVGQCGQQPGLATRSRAQVQPELVAALQRRRGQRHGDQLRALVLDGGSTLRHGRHRARVAALQHHAVRREAGRLSRQLVPRGPARSSDQGHQRVRVVGREQVVQLCATHRLGQLVDDPFGVAEGERGVPRRRAALVRRDPVDPLVEVVLAHRAQHRVDEVAGAGVHPRADQVDGGADRGVVGHPHRQQLVGADPQRVEHLRLDLRQRPVGAGRQDRVVGPASADGARGQLGGERRVAALELVVPDHRRQHQVGVGPVDADRLEDVERRGAGRVEDDLLASGRGRSRRPPLLSPRSRLSHRRGTSSPGTSAPWPATRR